MRRMRGIIWVIRVLAFAAVLACVAFAGGRIACAEDDGNPEPADYVIDLTKGYYYFSIEDEPNTEYLVFCQFENIPGWLGVDRSLKTDNDDSIKLDLDKDGTYDVLFRNNYNQEYGAGDVIAVPIAGGSIKDKITLNGSGTSPIRSVTFILNNASIKQEYKIKISGGHARSYTYDAAEDRWDWKEVTSAEPGTPMTICLDDNMIKKGQYVKEWSSPDYPFPKRKPYMVIGAFVMPAHDVTVSPVIEKQTPLTINLTRGDYGKWYEFEQYEENGCFFEVTGITGDIATIDLNGDGIEDIYLSPNKSSNMICALPVHSISKDITFNNPTDGKYWPITIHFPEPAYTLDLSSGMVACCNYGSGDTLIKLKENFKPFEMSGKDGYYDFDGNGQPDIRIMNWVDSEEESIVVLDTYSLGTSYVIPAAEGGFTKPITLSVKKAPSFHSVTIETGEGGKVVLYEQDALSEYFRIYYLNEDAGTYKFSMSGGKVMLGREGVKYPFAECTRSALLHGTAVYALPVPDEGYQLKSISYNDGQYTVDCNNLPFYVTNDITVTAEFEKAPEPTPTPTPTPSPTPTVAPTKEPTQTVTEEPTPVPDGKQDDGDENAKPSKNKDSDSGFNPILLIIPAVILVAGIVALVLVLKKKKPEDGTEEPVTKDEKSQENAQTEESAQENKE